MANITDDFFRREESRDSRIERLARESEQRLLLLKLHKCKNLKDFQTLTKELEESIK